MNSSLQNVEGPIAGAANIENKESTEKFQKFVCDLFEKNGILNDLRTYLRRHIVDVLKNAHTGNTPVCHKNFTQRLELTFQALNVLIAEYLLRLEFSYTLSVFVSEMPLANMVFDFTKALMGSTAEDVANIRFSENDVWSILNYLGIQCDSEHASHTMEMYRSNEQLSLLLCILKCLPMFQKVPFDVAGPHDVACSESLLSEHSSDTLSNKSKVLHRNPSAAERCSHLLYCKMCQAHMSRYKEKYRNKKRNLYENLNEEENAFETENVMKKISNMERNLIEEMFQQFKTVYEAEVEMVKEEEDKKLRRSMASHALQLQKQRDQLEESYKAREAELEHNVAEKKKFLWGLARALREKHQHMARAMQEVQAETKRLSARETDLQTRLVEAENLLRKRGDEMHSQISNELATLDNHLTAMKTERQLINKERTELETLKNIENDASKVIRVHEMDNAEIQSHYDLIKNEIVTLKKYIETSKFNAKSVTEKATVTDLRNVNSNLTLTLNNNQHPDKFKSEDFDDRLKDQLVNDFKKKNVNFTPSKVSELFRECPNLPDRSSGSSEAGDTPHTSREHQDVDTVDDILLRLTEENNRLKERARQQQSHIEALTGRGCACASARPRRSTELRLGHPTVSTPTPCQPQFFLHGVNTCASANTVSMSWYKGAGEELSAFSDAQPRILVPGDTIPFVGLLRDRPGHRRQLLSQMRTLRTRPLSSTHASKTPPPPSNRNTGSSSSKQPAVSMERDSEHPVHSNREKPERQIKSVTLDITRNRERSPKSVLREAKERLRNIKELTVAAREKGSNAILREAKLRLRKLEIEAEAVEKSYLDFQRRQSQYRVTRATLEGHSQCTDGLKRNADTNATTSEKKVEETKYGVDVPLTDYQKAIRSDFDKYLREYQTKLDIGTMHFKKQTTAEYNKPIPESYTHVPTKKQHSDYLETPMTEFRKLYRSNTQTRHSEKAFVKRDYENYDQKSPECSSSRQIPMYSQVHSILKKNTDNVYDIHNQDNANKSDDDPTPVNTPSHTEQQQNLLRVEVERVGGVQTTDDELLLVVQNTIDIREINVPQNVDNYQNITSQMVIVVSPRDSIPTAIEDVDVDLELQPINENRRSLSPEQEANLTRNDVLEAIFSADADYKISSVKESFSKETVSDEKRGETEYSADVDNYISRFSSPVSVLKTSDDEIVWD